MSDALCFTPARALAAAIRARTLSPVELLDAVLRRIERCDGRVNAFSCLDAQRAMDQARAAERAAMRGDHDGALLGVPVTIKDLFPVAGLPMEQGSRTQAGVAARGDAPVVERLRAAGAVLFAKTTTSEFGWSGISRSPATGATHNPWAHGLNAGASSAGAGAAAAAGFGPLHQGSDGAGSVRMPAHFCGVFGLKPSWGRIPQVPVRNNDQVSHIGPLCRTVADAALFLNATAGAHPFDHTSLVEPPGDYLADLARDVEGLRIAFSPDLGHARVDAAVAERVRAAAAAFEEFGCHVEEIAPDWGAESAELVRFFWPVHEAFWAVQTAQSASRTPLATHLDGWRERMDPGLVACVEAGLGHSAETYLALRARKLDCIERQHRFMAAWDLLLTPAASVAAFPVERLQPEDWPAHPWDWLAWSEFCHPFNMSGLPAASVPCGTTPEGLPVGLQIVGRRGADHAVLRAAATFERHRPWQDRHPAL